MQICFQLALKGVQDEVARAGGGEEEIFAIVAELESSPALCGSLTEVDKGTLNVLHVKGCKGRLVEVPHVVQEDGLSRRRSNGDDARGGVVGGEVGAMQVEGALWRRGAEIPELDSVVERGGQEGVVAGTHGQRGDTLGMTFEVANVTVVMGGEVADAIVDLCRGVDDGVGMVGEASQGTAILLGLELFCMGTGFGVVDLERVIGPGEEEELARGVKVEGSAMDARGFEELQRAGVRTMVGRSGVRTFGWERLRRRGRGRKGKEREGGQDIRV